MEFTTKLMISISYINFYTIPISKIFSYPLNNISQKFFFFF